MLSEVINGARQRLRGGEPPSEALDHGVALGQELAESRVTGGALGWKIKEEDVFKKREGEFFLSLSLSLSLEKKSPKKKPGKKQTIKKTQKSLTVTGSSVQLTPLFPE